MKIFEELKKNMAPNLEHTSPVDFLLVAGDGREDEVIFRWANDMEKDGTVANVTTVSLGSRNTEAGCTLTQGVTGESQCHPRNELITDCYTGVLTLLQKLAQLH